MEAVKVASLDRVSPGDQFRLPDGTELVTVPINILWNSMQNVCSACYFRNRDRECTATPCQGVVYVTKLEYCIHRISAAL